VTIGQVVELPLDGFLIADVFQSRTKLIPRQVKRLMQLMDEGIELDPIEVARLTDRPTRNLYAPGTKRLVSADVGTLALVHGFHRVTAARELGEEMIRAVVLPMTTNEARWHGACANRKNGEPQAKADYLNIFKTYVSTKRNRDGSHYKSYQTIKEEAQLPVHRDTLRRWMVSHFPAVARAMSRQEYGLDGVQDYPPQRSSATAADDPTAKAVEHFERGFQNAALAGVAGRNQLRRMLTGWLDELDRDRQHPSGSILALVGEAQVWNRRLWEPLPAGF
jgi:hypothetical protein